MHFPGGWAHSRMIGLPGKVKATYSSRFNTAPQKGQGFRSSISRLRRFRQWLPGYDAVATRFQAIFGGSDPVPVAIALATIKKDMPNTPIVGALSAVTGLIPIENVKKRLVITFGKKFSQEMIDANLDCAERAYKEVHE